MLADGGIVTMKYVKSFIVSILKGNSTQWNDSDFVIENSKVFINMINSLMSPFTHTYKNHFQEY